MAFNDDVNAVRQLIRLMGDDPNREGLADTPARVIRSFGELFGGYKQNPSTLMRTFDAEGCNEMVIVRNIEFHSTCEHHLLPFAGIAHVGYLPAERVIGLSKLGRLVDLFSRRLQIQERLTTQVTDALMEHLKPRGAGCIIEAQHHCMVCRGVRKQQATMLTSSLQGLFLSDKQVRSEFLQLVK